MPCLPSNRIVDEAYIAINRISHAVDCVQQVLHEANEQTQIFKRVERIRIRKI